MSTAQKINFITNRLEKVDEKFLEIVHAMFQKEAELEEDTLLGFETDGTAIYANEIEDHLEKEIEAAKNGKGFTVEALRKNAKSW